MDVIIGNKSFTLNQYVFEIKHYLSPKLKRGMVKKNCEGIDCTKSLPKHISFFPTEEGLKWFGYYGYQKGGRFCTKKCSDAFYTYHSCVARGVISGEDCRKEIKKDATYKYHDEVVDSMVNEIWRKSI